MTRIILITAMLVALIIPAAAKEDRGIIVRPIAPTGGEAKGDLWLLAIGIDSYLSWPRLKTATNDAKAVRDTLLSRYHLDKTHIIELLDDQATRKNILAAFRDLAKKVKPDDSLMVFYAGHGHIDQITGKGSWIPVESGTDDPSSWIDNRNITDYLSINAIKAKHVLLVSDSCFSGDFFRGNRGANTPTIDDAFLKKAYSRSSRQAISSGGLEPVSDAGFGGNSVFSHFLVAALQSNSKSYLIPSEIFGEIKSGVGRNAEQLPQYGDLHNVGGQDGGELVLFLKQENRLQEVGVTSAARQKELALLKKTEAEAIIAKQKEQAEIAKREQELATLDKQIADMKGRLGAGAARSGDSLDNIMALAEQKEAQGNRLEELRKQRVEEEKKRQQEIEQLKKDAAEKRVNQIKADLAKYQKIANSKYAQDMKGSAWDALLATYPETKGVAVGDADSFLAVLELALNNGKFISLAEKKRIQEKDAEENLAKKKRQDEEDAKRRILAGMESERNGFRFYKNVVEDISTGLMWSRKGNIASPKAESWSNNLNWNKAMELVKTLDIGGYSDWRLPTQEELAALAKRGGNQPSGWFNANGFTDVKAKDYWSSTSDTNAAISVNMNDGNVKGWYKPYDDVYLWPVRSGELNTVAEAPATAENLAFLEGDWKFSIGDMKINVHLTVRGNQVEYSSSPGDYKAIYTAKLTEDTLVFSGKSTSHPQFGEIIEKYKVSGNRSMNQFFSRVMGRDNEVKIDWQKK